MEGEVVLYRNRRDVLDYCNQPFTICYIVRYVRSSDDRFHDFVITEYRVRYKTTLESGLEVLKSGCFDGVY